MLSCSGPNSVASSFGYLDWPLQSEDASLDRNSQLPTYVEMLSRGSDRIILLQMDGSAKLRHVRRTWVTHRAAPH